MKLHYSLSGVAIVAVLAILLPAVLAKLEEGEAKKRVPKQIHTKGSSIESDADHSGAETGFGGGGGGGGGLGHGKYFQYQHNPEHDHYEFGYRRGNDHHFQERYEKAAPHEGKFKTKVRWGDKKGGYGEHYYDYNHAGHGDEGGDGGGGGSNDGGEGGYSEPIPDYKQANDYHNSKTKRHSKAQSAPVTEARTYVKDQSRASSRVAQKRSSPAPVDVSRLVFDVASGLVVDEITGQAFNLQPVN